MYVLFIVSLALFFVKTTASSITATVSVSVMTVILVCLHPEQY